MYVIGISSGIKHGHHDGAAVLLREGELIAAAEAERLYAGQARPRRATARGRSASA
ncbi:putative NodU family carbamoyl transferase [Bradyrhizobium sp. LB9.1b]